MLVVVLVEEEVVVVEGHNCRGRSGESFPAPLRPALSFAFLQSSSQIVSCTYVCTSCTLVCVCVFICVYLCVYI